VSCFHRAVRSLVLVLTLLGTTLADQPVINGLPGSPTWQISPLSWHLEHGSELTIRSGKETDWFVDPFDGTVHSTAPLLLFAPADDYVLNTKVKVNFNSKWDAGALMVWVDDHHWAKLSFELSPAKQPTMVTVVTRGLSDDCNSMAIPGTTVYLQVAKSGPAYVFYSSADGRNWQILRVFSLGDVSKARVGFESQSPAGDGTEVIFSEIHYSTRKIANIYSSEGL
jgi:regulation of enolase protein 1 (concanavalin A-like superfamily)